MLRDKPAEWSATATADNAAATVTRAAEAAGRVHYVTGISGSFSASGEKLMTLKSGTVVRGNYHVHNQRDVLFDPPLKMGTGEAVELSLAASGTAGTVGAVTLTGFTLGG